MEDDEHGGPQAGREVAEQRPQGLDASRGGRDDHDIPLHEHTHKRPISLKCGSHAERSERKFDRPLPVSPSQAG
ncbi:hypothetical protein Misp03_61490 [Microbispora sp. NBRC 16548]|nr:hypothetical protein Misp03_61490 [Microbispora sp. NBRC 16548]